MPKKMEELIGNRMIEDKGLQVLHSILNENAKQLIYAL